mmetsp:Transcript_19111/g.38993  ORF Transcript_19111/g.38993 Transcript_19111/m.38993 type:complete len:135 (-) Transcript_19111:1190-1594(-)
MLTSCPISGLRVQTKLNNSQKVPLYKSLLVSKVQKTNRFSKTIYSKKNEEEEKEHDLTEENGKSTDTGNQSKNSVFLFIKEVAEETRMVEWPSLDRLFKQFVIVVISLVLSAFVIYSVDGIFASISQFLFEGKN